ncbi:hypothetical protein Q9L58_003134 [Maublancomyces gigas]|uniref:Uncharacterized protein n=1 Tax=Discina gigas TaxID=1032678 RepID=A0ABR3GPV8_9PEZI
MNGLLSSKGERVTYENGKNSGEFTITWSCSAGGYVDRFTTVCPSRGDGLPGVHTRKTKLRHGYLFFKTFCEYESHYAFATRKHNDLVNLNGVYLVRLPALKLTYWAPTTEQADILLIATGEYTPSDY